MSMTDPAQMRTSAKQYSATGSYSDEDAGYGWVLFAGVMLAMLATVNFIEGVAAVSNSSFFVGDAKFILSDLNTWGWVLIVISAVQLVTALGVWAQWTGVRWVGVLVAAVNAVVQLTFMPAYPFWSLCLFTLNILVIYGLIAHGARARA
jgi:hypothetical protein